MCTTATWETPCAKFGYFAINLALSDLGEMPVRLLSSVEVGVLITACDFQFSHSHTPHHTNIHPIPSVSTWFLMVLLRVSFHTRGSRAQ